MSSDDLEVKGAESAALLEQRIKESGLSARAFAATIGRDERSVRRWLDHDPMPRALYRMLKSMGEQPNLLGDA
jgi:hypothetical protein